MDTIAKEGATDVAAWSTSL